MLSLTRYLRHCLLFSEESHLVIYYKLVSGQILFEEFSKQLVYYHFILFILEQFHYSSLYQIILIIFEQFHISCLLILILV